jgi:hypothetical protein
VTPCQGDTETRPISNTYYSMRPPSARVSGAASLLPPHAYPARPAPSPTVLILVDVVPCYQQPNNRLVPLICGAPSGVQPYQCLGGHSRRACQSGFNEPYIRTQLAGPRNSGVWLQQHATRRRERYVPSRFSQPLIAFPVAIVSSRFLSRSSQMWD